MQRADRRRGDRQRRAAVQRAAAAARAKRTELLLGVILGTMLLGLAVLASRWHIGPRSGQTVLSQIMGDAVGRHWAYYIVSLTITLVLSLAANTSFGGLPVLASLLARDNYLPHLFALRGDRQVFANGIWALAILSGALLVAVGGNTNSLIPLFAIGVFTGFTLAQSGLVVHWWRTRPAALATSRRDQRARRDDDGGRDRRLPVLEVPRRRVGRRRRRADLRLALRADPRLLPRAGRCARARAPPGTSRRQALARDRAGDSGLAPHRSTRSPRRSRSASEVIAVTVVLDGGDEGAAEGDALQAEWAEMGSGRATSGAAHRVRSVVEPISSFIDELRANDDRQIVVLIPTIIPDRVRYRILHNQIDLVLSGALRSRPTWSWPGSNCPRAPCRERRARRRPAAGRSPSPKASKRRSR